MWTNTSAGQVRFATSRPRRQANPGDLDCGIFERGFARIRCPVCATEFAAFLQEEVVADVGHAQWVFTVPKLLRPYFMHHRELPGPLCTAARQTVRELQHAIAVLARFPRAFVDLRPSAVDARHV